MPPQTPFSSLRGRGEDRLHLVKADCDERELLRAGRIDGIEGVNIVIDDNGGSLRGIRIDLLIGEGNAVAAGDKDDLTGRVRKSDFSPPYFTVSSGSVGSPMNTKSYSVPLLSSDLSSVVKAALLQVAPPVNVLPTPSA